MSFEPLRSILKRSATVSPISSELKIAQAFEAFDLVMARLWGEEKARLVRPVSFKEGRLKVETVSPGAKQQIALDAIRLKNEINRYLGGQIVMEIIVRSVGF